MSPSSWWFYAFILSVRDLGCYGQLKHMRAHGRGPKKGKTEITFDASNRFRDDSSGGTSNLASKSSEGSGGGIDFGGNLIVSDADFMNGAASPGGINPAIIRAASLKADIVNQKVSAPRPSAASSSSSGSSSSSESKRVRHAVRSNNSSVVKGREAHLEAIRQKQGIILFTHIRRAGGTVLEDYVLKPFVKSTKRQAYLCKEGELGR